MKRKLLIFLLLLSINIIAQNKRAEINGTILNTNSLGIANTHVINLSTKLGTVTDALGKFKLHVNIGDWLQISNLQYQQKITQI